MTDNEIIKALGYCIKNDIAQCKICAYDKFEQGCRRKLNPDILDLINRQQSEIERLEKRLETQAEEFGKLREELNMALATKIENKIYIDKESYEKMTEDVK